MSEQPETSRHTPAEHLVMAEDILDAAGMQPINLSDRQAWAAQAQAAALLAGGHILMAAILSEDL